MNEKWTEHILHLSLRVPFTVVGSIVDKVQISYINFKIRLLSSRRVLYIISRIVSPVLLKIVVVVDGC